MPRLKKTSGKKRKSKLSTKSGLPPGSLVYTGSKSIGETGIRCFSFDEKGLVEHVTNKTENLKDWVYETSSFNWIQVSGLNNADEIQSVCNQFGIHPLVQEDILHIGQRTKLEDFEEYFDLTYKILMFNKEDSCIDTEQISIILGNNYILTFEEKDTELMQSILDRLRNYPHIFREKTTDFLLYKFLDAAVDRYFILIDEISDLIEDIEEEVLHQPTESTAGKIQGIKKELMILSKHVLPMREVLNKLETGESALITDKFLNYFRDVYDHSLQAYDTIDTHRSLLSDMMNLYYTGMSNKLNEVMKVLTIFSTLFMPLSFLAGVYGMNFSSLPGANFPDAFLYFCFACVGIGIIMFGYFRYKKWF